MARVPDLRVPLAMMAVIGTFAYEFQVSLPTLTTQRSTAEPKRTAS